MTRQEVIKELARREKEQGVAAFANENYSVDEIYYLLREVGGDDDAMLLSDDLETRLEDLSKDGWEFNKFMRALFSADELVCWGVK